MSKTKDKMKKVLSNKQEVEEKSKGEKIFDLYLTLANHPEPSPVHKAIILRRIADFAEIAYDVREADIQYVWENLPVHEVNEAIMMKLTAMMQRIAEQR